MPKLRDEHGEMAASIYSPRPSGVSVGTDQSASTPDVRAGELEQHAAKLMARIRRSAVLPVDDADSTVRGAEDVVGPQVAVTRLQLVGRLDPGLQSAQLVAQSS
jgi:hypothetical protein